MIADEAFIQRHDEDIHKIKQRLQQYEADKRAENEAHVRAVANVASQVGRLRYDVISRFSALGFMLFVLTFVVIVAEILDLYIHATR